MDLTQSNPTACGFKYPPEILKALNNPDNLRYNPQAKGMLTAREVVVGYYARKGISLSAEQVILTASTSEAYSFLFRLLADYNERVLFPCPSYPLFEFLVNLNDLKMDYYRLQFEGNWRIDLKDLNGGFFKDTRAIVVVNPNNPTGTYIEPGELNHLNQLCEKHNAAIISDEVFLDYAFENSKPLSLSANKEALTFCLGGLSKALGLPQMKLSWIVVNGPSALVEEALKRLEVIADTYLSVSTPVQNALPVWFKFYPKIHEMILSRVRKNWLSVKKILSGNSTIQYLNAQAGWYAVLKISTRKSEEAWVMELLEKDHVCVHPGYFFDFPQEAFLILSLLPEEKIFAEGLRRIVKRIG